MFAILIIYVQPHDASMGKGPQSMISVSEF